MNQTAGRILELVVSDTCLSLLVAGLAPPVLWQHDNCVLLGVCFHSVDLVYFSMQSSWPFIRLNKPTPLLSTCKTFSSSSHTGNPPLLLFLLCKEPVCSMLRILYRIILQLSAFLLLWMTAGVLPSSFWKALSRNTPGFFSPAFLTAAPLILVH